MNGRRARFVLVEPQHGGNVGAVARVMWNFGLDDLAIAGEVPSLEGEAEWWATGGGEVLRNLRRFDSLEDAVADCHLVVGTTAARAREMMPALEPETLAEEVRSLGEGERAAIVFGREANGLTSSELALCGRTATIPASAEFPTLNIAQAAGIFAWEISKSGATESRREGEKRAPHEMVERLHRRGKELLERSGFLNPQNPDEIHDELRRLLARADPTEREVMILIAAVRKLSWWVDGSDDSPNTCGPLGS
ncbi:MAG: RNA methyltransferase [Acidobacteria bacterium]|nr:RNA methyltransferase [Acidobacteriota bacterium]